MITSAPWGPEPTAAADMATTSAVSAPDAVRYRVRTSALGEVCDGLERAVQHGRRLLEHPGVVRGRAQDGGNDDLRDAAVLLADRWQWGLQVLLDEATTLLHDLRSASLLYDAVERTSVPAPPAVPRGVR
jgi:hypothetical protein